MSNQPIYLDYAATTPVDPVVADAMCQCLTIEGNFGNPASRSHLYGWKAEQAVEQARKKVATLLNCDTREIVWTSGATEADNLAIKGIANAYSDCGKHIVTSAIEHKAVLDSCAFLEQHGFEVTYIKPNAEGVITLDSVKASVREDTILVSLMHVNNELGSVNDVGSIGAFLRERKIWFHVDAAQSAGKLAIDLEALNVDLMSFSAHKIYGPKGVGALYVNRNSGVKLDTQIHGGGHERGMRSGTLATHQLVGMGEAFGLAKEKLNTDFESVKAKRQMFLETLKDLDGVHVNGSSESQYPGVLNIGFDGVDGETLLMSLSKLAVSSGSACTSASVEPSYVLKAIGLSDALAHASLRFSFGRFTTEEDVLSAGELLRDTVSKLRA